MDLRSLRSLREILHLSAARSMALRALREIQTLVRRAEHGRRELRA